tara:strand:- start:596 stop:2218 length:1623 start_codon:yes stop_codon:yes gene_type:complete
MKYFLPLFLILAGLLVGYGAFALSYEDITYPIAELGNCENEEACLSYCDDPDHFDECIAFAEEYNLMTPEELAKAKKFREIGAVGPGGCQTEQECEIYCEDVNHIEECLAFAEEHGFMEEDELEEARMIAKALREGAQFPGGCQSEVECEAYCEDPNHMQECIAFAEAAGFMSHQELQEAKQMMKALDAGVSLPGDCQGEQECDEYCEEPAHAEECIEFAIAAGFIPPEEVESVRSMIPLMQSGRMPEWCKDKEQCEAYCDDESHINECTDFFIEAGFMTEEEAVMFRKTGGKGPGDCKGKEECESYCNDPANQEVCFEFAREHGLISEGELRNMEEGVRQFQDWFATAPPEVAQCLREQVGEETLQEIQAGTFMPGLELINNLEQCFQLQQQIVENQMRECLSKSCDEFFSCMGGISQQGGGGGPRDGGPDDREHGEEGEGGGFFGGGALEQELQAKMDACMQEQFERQQQEFFPSEFEHQGDEQFPGGGFEGEFIPQEFQQQFQELEQLQQQLQEQQAPTGGSVLDIFLYFLRPLLPR